MHIDCCESEAKNADTLHVFNICSCIRALVLAELLTCPVDLYELHCWQRISVVPFGLIVILPLVCAEWHCSRDARWHLMSPVLKWHWGRTRCILVAESVIKTFGPLHELRAWLSRPLAFQKYAGLFSIKSELCVGCAKSTVIYVTE